MKYNYTVCYENGRREYYEGRSIESIDNELKDSVVWVEAVSEDGKEFLTWTREEQKFVPDMVNGELTLF